MAMAAAEYEHALIKVFWDIENCPIPRGCKAEEIVPRLRSALSKKNYRGPISIAAYGNLNHIPPSVKQALSSNGVVLNHTYPRKISMLMCIKMMSWPLENPALSNLMLISRDETQYVVLDKLRSMGFNILLAHPPNTSEALLARANTAWIFRSLLEEDAEI